MATQPGSVVLESSGLVISRTWLNQSRIATQQNGVSGFQIITVVTRPGLLPDTGVFVMQLNDHEDSTQDTYVAVAKCAEFDAYPSSRAAAITLGGTNYRTSVLTLFYTDITVARFAAKNVKDQVDALVRDWLTFEYQFEAGPPGDFVYLPSANRAIIAALINTWQTAHSATVIADAALVNAEIAVAAADQVRIAASAQLAALQSLKSTIDLLKPQSDALANIITNMVLACLKIGDEPSTFPDYTLPTNGTGFWQRLNILLNAVHTQNVVALQGVVDVFLNDINGVSALETVETLICETSLETARANYRDTTAQVTAAAVLIISATDAKALADANYLVALNRQTAAQAAYDTALAQEQGALDAARQACPQFDTNNPTALLV